MSDVTAFIHDVKISRPRKGFKEVFMPGEIESKSYDKAITEGVKFVLDTAIS